jgi:putative ABC transport system permease protein
MLVYVLQLVLNIGALFVILGVLLLATNGMMLSVFERSSEFAVMRAMGASRRFVFALVIQESFMLVFGSAFLGLFLGAMASLLLNALYIEVANPYIVMLLGSNSIHSTLKLGLFLLHALGAMCIAIVASVFPVRKVLVIQPSRAMA